MTANKMPEAVAFRFLSRAAGGLAWSMWLPIAELHHYDARGNLSPGPGPSWERVEYLHDGRACYLAGLEAAKACVPEVADEDAYQYDRAEQYGHNNCRNLTLTSLTALEQEAKK